MAGTIIGNISLGASDWSTWITRQERGERGHLQVSLTNFGVTTASSIATGSVMECAGSIYQFTETSISLATGTASANTAVYYVVIPSAGGTTVTIVMDSTAPTWVDAKQGFYASAASISRVIGGCYIGTALVYYEKWLYHQGGQEAFRIYADGSIGKLNASAATIIGALTVGSIISSGQIGIIGASRVRAKRSTAQSMSSGTVTIVQYNTEDFDNLGEWDAITNYQFQPQQTGYYSIGASFAFVSTAWTAGKFISLMIYKNGTLFSVLDYHVIEASITLIIEESGNDIIYLLSSDYIDIRISHDQGASVNLVADAVYNYVAIHRMS